MTYDYMEMYISKHDDENNTSQRVKLPEGVFDMTTAIHGIYE